LRKDEKMRTIYETIAPHVTRTGGAWKDYLDFAARFFKRSFDNVLLVYAQNPKVTLLATVEEWNKLGRFVNSKENGLAVCEYENAKLSLKYLFDISQTHGKEVKPTNWQLGQNMKEEITKRLAFSHGFETRGFSELLHALAAEAVADNYEAYLQDISIGTENHIFSELPEGGFEAQFIELLTDSVQYFIAKRCSIPDDDIRLGDGMMTVGHFNTLPHVAVLGNAVTSISKNILIEMERTIKIINKERTDEANGQTVNRTELHRERRTDAAQRPNIQQQRGRQPAPGPIRTDGNEIPARKPSPAVYDFENGWHSDGENAQGTQGSNGENRVYNPADVGNQSNTGNRGHHGEDPSPEQSEVSSGGNHTERDRIQSEISPPQSKQTEEPPESENESPPGGSFFSAETQDLQQNAETEAVENEEELETSNEEESFENRIGDFNIPDELDEMHIPDSSISPAVYIELDDQALYSCVDGYLCNTQMVYKGWHDEIAVEFKDGNGIDTYILSDYIKDIEGCGALVDGHIVTCTTVENGVEFLVDHYVVPLAWAELSDRIKELIQNETFPIAKAGKEIKNIPRLDERDAFVPKPVGSQQMSLFDMVDAPKDKETELIEYVLLKGSRVTGGKQRIYDFAQTKPTGSAFEKMLKNEYGIGGHTINEHGIHFENHDSKGIIFDWTDEKEEKHETKITWLRAAIVIQRLIDQGRYLKEPVQPQTLEPEKPSERISATETGKVQISQPNNISTLEPIVKPQHIKTNFRYSEDYNLYPGGEKTKYKNNVEAIKLLKRIEEEKRLATQEEQITLARYVGWGGLANAFSDTAKGWEKEYHELKHLLDEKEYADARNSVITAYYTEPALIKRIYKAIGNFGFKGGPDRKILDPATGTGNYFSVLPEEYEDIPIYGVELDSITGRIAQQLYQKADIQVKGFEATRFEDNNFDIVIGNIPFNSIKLYDKRYEKEDFHIHDYFIAKSLDLVKPGGIISYITSKGTMDSKDTTVREYIARRADLIGAIRLPNTAFKSLAGTEVTADILFFKKLDQQRTCDKYSLPDWVFTNSRKSDYMNLNQYFIDHPEMVLGEMQYSKRMYGREDDTACIAPPGQDLYTELDRTVGNLNATFTAQADQPVEEAEEIEEENTSVLDAPAGTKNYTYVVQDGKIYYCEHNKLLPQDYIGIRAERIKGLCEIRKALLEVIQIQTHDYVPFDLKQAQKILNEVYDRFVKKYGAINEKANILAFSDDDQFPLLRSIEDQSKDKKSWSKAPIFHKATIRSYRRPTHAETAKEALEICLNEKMKVDLPYMERLTGKTADQLIEELGERIYLNPQKYYGNYYEGWELNEEYLSGQVRDKLLYAKQKAEEYPELFERNVKALEAVQPKWLEPSEIDFRIGSPWIPIEYFRQFMYETFGTSANLRDKITLDYMEYTTTWYVEGKMREPTSVKVNNTFGTKRVNAYQIFEDCLNLQSTTVRDAVPYVDKNGKDQVKYVVNAGETMIARAKQNQIKEAFASWLFKDKNRADILLKLYNEKFNTIRPRVYNGDHLVFSGMSEEMELRPHQQNFAARVIYSGTGLAGHVVGAGKTASMIAAGMYLKNIGAIKKPIYVVPNHLTEQWAKEFYRFFPQANILVTTKKDFEAKNRNKFVSKIAMGEYDAIVIGHSQFEKIPISKERQEAQLNKEINQLTHIIKKMKEEKGDNWAVKQMVIFQNNLKARLDRLAAEQKKDDLLTFEQLGIDTMFVDEAHTYKNCFTYTKMRNVAGIGKAASQRAMDMLLKCQYLQEINSGKGVVFATGTPISNSMSEMYVMQRYLQPQMLARLGLNYFDAWAATFGEVVSSLEITPEGSGYRMRNRFAKFHNLPELMSIFQLVADIQTADMLNLPIPEIEGGKASIIVTEATPYQKMIMESFVERAEKIRKQEVEPYEDNMLKLTGEAKLMSIDPRLVYRDAPNDPDSKLNISINNVFNIWQESKEQRLTQLVFCDSGTPKSGQFNVYDEMKKCLVEKGIPEKEIAFVHDAKTDEQREALFEKVRMGEIRILLGSTGKLGTGTNVQNKLVAVHHLDCPWRPSDIEQRDGRILRQGNENPVVRIFRYVTKGTFDAYLWQIQEQKLKYITQVMTGKSISRSCEDMDETVLSAAEVKAVATSNPLLAEKMEIDNEVIRLKLLKGNWNNERLALERRIKHQYPEDIDHYEKKISNIGKDLELLKRTEGKEFSIVLDGKAYDERVKAGEHLQLLAKDLTAGSEPVAVGEFRGFRLFLQINAFKQLELYVRGSNNYDTPLGESALGGITRLENTLDRLPAILANVKEKLEDTKTQLQEAKKEVQKPFEYELGLNEYLTRQTEINTKLEFKELQQKEEVIFDEGEATEEASEEENLEVENA
jgi:N12 class adenine-specific DNA methylase/adenine-specific DNA methylase